VRPPTNAIAIHGITDGPSSIPIVGHNVNTGHAAYFLMDDPKIPDGGPSNATGNAAVYG